MHPLTKEKIAIKGLADRVRNMKTTLELGHLYQEPEVTAMMQKRMASLSRAIRHRHVAYTLVRKGIGGVDVKLAAKTAGVEDEPLRLINYDLVNHHRIRLSNEIMKYQSDHIERLMRSGKKPMIMGLGHFEPDEAGDFVSEPAPCDGVAYILPCYPGAEQVPVEDGEDIYDSLIRAMRPLGFFNDEQDEHFVKMVLKGEIDSYSVETTSESEPPCCPCDDELWDEFFDAATDESSELSQEEWDRLGKIAKAQNKEMDERIRISKCAMTSDLDQDKCWKHWSGVDDCVGMPGEGFVPDITKPHQCPYLGEYHITDFVCNAGGGICKHHAPFGECEVYLYAADIDS